MQLTNCPETGNRYLTWEFPLERTHCGIPLANGRQGVLVWGEETLNLTVARAGFWDHRGGTPFTLKATFGKVRELLEANDEAGIKALFQKPANSTKADRPQQLGGARIEIKFADGLKPETGRLNLETGELTVLLKSAVKEAEVLITQSYEEDVAWLDLGSAQVESVACRPAWEWCQEKMEDIGIGAPRSLAIEDGGGFVQEMPEDDALALVWRLRGERILISTALGECEDAAKEAVTRARAIPDTDSKYFWKSYWRDLPKLKLPDAEFQAFWELALYRQAGITPPDGVAATLQGPWMEEYQIPPWSNDYHFNINAQMIYWPALATNRLDHFTPLWTMIKEWMPTLKENGAKFFEADGALMLPHAVDDRCQVVGTFWTGTIDHACTAWVAQMAWLHYRYSLDESILREIAWPLLNGAFNGYWAMLEEVDGKLSLPVSVSPEYRGSQMNAWGRDASFQLAALHMTAQIIGKAAGLLGIEPDRRWAEVRERVPPYTLVNGRMGLWEGLELEESHRHHAHLGAIYPFCSIDPLSEEHWSVVAKSMHYWTRHGAGYWTGWCLPWAASLCARCNLPDAAVSWLHWMLDNFTNAGYGSRHNADFPGTACYDDGQLWNNTWMSNAEVMQMDATMGFITAVTELLVQQRQDVLYVVPKLPRRWRTLEFDGILCEGAFLVGATISKGETTEVRVKSKRGGELKIATGLRGHDAVTVVQTTAGQEIVFSVKEQES